MNSVSNITRSEGAYIKSANAISTGNSFTDSYGYESDIIKRIRDELGEQFPKKHRRDIEPTSEVFASGNTRYLWHLVDTTDAKNEKLVASRTAIKMVSKKNCEEYYMISKFSRNWFCKQEKLRFI